MMIRFTVNTPDPSVNQARQAKRALQKPIHADLPGVRNHEQYSAAPTSDRYLGRVSARLVVRTNRANMLR